MNHNLLWGTKTLQMMKTLRGNDRKIAIIRHSERPSLNNIPTKNWDQISLTKRGTFQAVEFGRAIVANQNVKYLQVLGWGQRRCMLTAEAISKGAEQEGGSVLGPFPIAFKSPIIDREKYREIIRSARWDQFIADWLGDVNSYLVMVPAMLYAKELLRFLLSEDLCGFDKITVVTTHDINILPLARLLFPSSQNRLDYLDGVVLKVSGEKIKLGFNGTIISVDRNEL